MSRSPSSSYTLEGLAEAAGMSKYHFLRIFRKYTGMTPFAMLNQIRCREALALLECTDLPVKIIAQRAGFADSSHMRKRLLEYSGSAPGRLRKKHC